MYEKSGDSGKGKQVVHLTCASRPWLTGGREVFSLTLAQGLKRLGWNNLLVYHQNESVREPLGSHEFEGIQIEVLPPLPEINRNQVYSCRTSEVPGYQELLQKIQPDIVHFHDFSRGANLLHLEETKKTLAKSVMTFHSPGQTCLQRELLYNGITPCDGEIKLDRCTACRLGVQGIPAWLRWPLARMSLPETGEGRISRAFSARYMTKQFVQSFRDLIRDIDGIHILSKWMNELMERNHVPAEKRQLIHTGLPFEATTMPKRERRDPDLPLQIVLIGRCDRIKGQEILIEAVKSLPISAKVEVAFYGPYWDTTDYGKRCLSKIEGDHRFMKPRHAQHQEIPSILRHADVLVVPSLWLETGPLVVMEAFAQRLPVIGSRLGGIAELVEENKTGLLFSPGDSQQLSRCLLRLIEDAKLLQQLGDHIELPRTMQQVAIETAQWYSKLLT